MGSDVLAETARKALQVSIHAPTWGATSLWHLLLFLAKFQSTLPHGERHSNGNKRIQPKVFQSTLPHGERPAPLTHIQSGLLFQSTLPHGERRSLHGSVRSSRGFNPRSHMGSDANLSTYHADAKFQSTLPHGERRPNGICPCVSGGGFNPRSHMGSDQPAARRLANLWSFNPRSHMGSDLSLHQIKHKNYVSIHAPTWGATYGH